MPTRPQDQPAGRPERRRARGWLAQGWPLLRVAVAEESMLPGLRPGDWLLARRTRKVRPGQVVLAWHPQRPGFLLVKRVAWREDGGWWLASDNAVPGAADSATFGAAPDEAVVGVVLFRYWPLFR